MQISHLAFIGCLALSPALWCEDEGKVITLDQLPAAVKEAVLKQVADAKIKEIEQETKDGKTVYEVTFGDTEVTFDAAGKVLKSKVEKDDEDDDQDGDKDDHKGEKKEHGHQDHKDK